MCVTLMPTAAPRNCFAAGGCTTLQATAPPSDDWEKVGEDPHTNWERLVRRARGLAFTRRKYGHLGNLLRLIKARGRGIKDED